MENSYLAVFFSALWTCHLIDFLLLLHSYEKLAVHFTEDPLYVMSPLSSAVFKILCLSTVILWCLCMDLFQFILLVICWTTWMFLSILEINLTIISWRYYFCVFISLLSFWYISYAYVCVLDGDPEVSYTVFIFLLFFRLDFLNWSIFNFTDPLFCELKNTIKYL